MFFFCLMNSLVTLRYPIVGRVIKPIKLDYFILLSLTFERSHASFACFLYFSCVNFNCFMSMIDSFFFFFFFGRQSSYNWYLEENCSLGVKDKAQKKKKKKKSAISMLPNKYSCWIGRHSGHQESCLSKRNQTGVKTFFSRRKSCNNCDTHDHRTRFK